MASEMKLLRKPQHPHYESCSKQECRNMIDVSSVKTIALITSKMDEKMKESIEQQKTNSDLKRINAVLKLKDELHQELREMNHTIQIEMTKGLDDRLRYIIEKIDLNAKNIATIQATLTDMTTDMRTKCKETHETIKSDEATLKSMSDKLQSEHKELQTLTGNVKKLYDAYNNAEN